MTIQEATYFLLNQLRTIHSNGEASQITDWVMEHLTSSKKAERMVYKNAAITAKEEVLLVNYTKRLMQHEPVQYVLNEAWFYGIKFFVDCHVLIPRPETEELVEWICNDFKNKNHGLKILDIGTGSGCIPVAIKRKLKEAEVWSCDISEEALTVAKKNAAITNTTINFLQLDFLDATAREDLPVFDIIVSNPPYIPAKDAAAMLPNVLNYEPATALFVPDNDPLLFYKAITNFSKTHLNKKGNLYLEIHEDLGDAVVQLLESEGFSALLKKDIQQKNRMIKSGLV